MQSNYPVAGSTPYLYDLYMLPFITLAFNTVGLWFFVTFLHKFKHRFTIIPFYATIAVLTMFTHILSSLNLSVTFYNFFFLVASTAYFTPLLLALFILYLSEGVHATRKAFEIIIGTSLLLVVVIAVSSIEDTKNLFIPSNMHTYVNYFWSILAMSVDVVLISIGWELINKIKKIPTFVSLIILMFTVYMVDTFIYVTAIFGRELFYWDIIKSAFVVRGSMSVLMGVFLARYLAATKFSEEKRQKPTKLWEILDFRSEDERQVLALSARIREKERAEIELTKVKDLYKSVLEAVDVGIWDWNIATGEVTWSERTHSMLGYTSQDFPHFNFDKFMDSVYPDDIGKVKTALEKHMRGIAPYHVELRVKTKSGQYKWFSSNGKAQFNDKQEPVRMVGSLMDIDEKKNFEQKLNENVAELSKLNKFFVDRELKMTELKNQLAAKEATTQ